MVKADQLWNLKFDFWFFINYNFWIKILRATRISNFVVRTSLYGGNNLSPIVLVQPWNFFHLLNFVWKVGGGLNGSILVDNIFKLHNLNYSNNFLIKHKSSYYVLLLSWWVIVGSKSHESLCRFEWILFSYYRRIQKELS